MDFNEIRKEKAILDSKEKEQKLVREKQKQDKELRNNKMKDIWNQFLFYNSKLPNDLRLQTGKMFAYFTHTDPEYLNLQLNNPNKPKFEFIRSKNYCLMFYENNSEFIIYDGIIDFRNGFNCACLLGTYIYIRDNNIAAYSLQFSNIDKSPEHFYFELNNIDFLLKRLCLNKRPLENLNNNLSLKRIRNYDSTWCFIATAVYGSQYADEVVTLREFRDNWLLKYKLGNLFVNYYYKLSPPIANYISKRKIIKSIVKHILIIPLIKVCKHLS